MAKPAQGEIYVMLLEKAVAKLLGSYHTVGCLA